MSKIEVLVIEDELADRMWLKSLLEGIGLLLFHCN